MPRRPRVLNRIVHELTFALHGCLPALVRSADLVLVISPPLPLAWLVTWVGRLRRRPTWLYVQDIQPGTAISLDMLRNRWLRRVLRWMERSTYRGADTILTLNGDMAEWIRGHVPDEKLGLLPLSIDVPALLDHEGLAADVARLPETDAIKGRSVVLYSGNLGVKHDPELLVECAAQMRAETPDTAPLFVIAGDGARRHPVEEKIAEQQRADPAFDHAICVPLVDSDLLPARLAHASALVLLQRPQVHEFGTPSKLLSYLASARPVIAAIAADSEAARWLMEHDAARLVEPGDVNGLAEAVRWVLEHPREAHDMAMRGRAAVLDSFSHEVVRTEHYAPRFGHVQAP